MKSRVRSVLSAGLSGLAIGCSLVAWGAANGQDVNDRNIKFAFANTQDSARGVGAKKFSEVVAQKSGGKLSIKLYPGGTLGGEAVMASAMQGGTVECR